jgi:DNA-binding beta-propeller fold protein YncE
MTDFFQSRLRLIVGAIGCFVLAGALVAVLSGAHADALPRPATAARPAVTASERIFAAFWNNVVEINPATGAVKVMTNHVSQLDHGPYLFVTALNGKTVYLVNENAGEVVPYSVATGQPGKAISVGHDAEAALVAPNGTLYVGSKGIVTRISTATNTAGPPINVHVDVASMVITPDGKTLYVADDNTGVVVPVSTATNTPGKPIKVGRDSAITDQTLAITPNGKTLYVAEVSGAIIPISTATGRKGAPFKVSGQPEAIAITPNGKTAYVIRGGPLSAVSPLDLATHHVGKSIPVPGLAEWIMMSPDGKTVYIGYLGGPVIPINTATNVKGPFFGWSQLTMAMAFTPGGGSTAYTCGWKGIIPVSTRTDTLGTTLYDPPIARPPDYPCSAIVVTP